MIFSLELVSITINGILAGIITLYVIWDHIKDDLMLRRRVQEFYEDIENLIVLYTKKQLAKLFKDVYAGKVKYPDILKELDEYQNKHYYIMNKVKRSFKENSKYLGLIVTTKDYSKYLNETHFILCENGQLRRRLGYLIIEDNTNIKSKELDEVKSYLKSLRDYWKTKYKRLLQKKLQKKLNIDALVDFMRNLNNKFSPNPQSEEELLIKGNLHYFSNEFENAIEYYDKAITKNKSFCLAWNNKGNSYLGQNQYIQASKCFEECFSINKDFVFAYNGKAMTYMRQKKYGEALVWLDDAIILNSSIKTIWNNKGICHGYRKEFEQSIQSLETAKSLDNKYSNAHYNKACAHSGLGEIEEVLKSLKKAIELDYKWKKKAMNDPSFNNLRQFTEFKELMDTI